ncbi:MAG: hypothetical protein MUF36_12995 [Bacteroidales bacterium]|jgi:hypothetical protein|nr:hypothetical protein [Bacteroidales bacterium]
MKKIKILGFIVILMMYSISCEELPDPAGERGVAVVPGIINLNPGVFDVNDLQNAYVQFTVILPAGVTVPNATLIGSYNNNHADVTIKELSTFPAVVNITSVDAAQKLGIALADIERGDVFDFELLITTDGRTTRSTPLVIPVACVYTTAMSTGSFHSVSEDWNSEGDITITADPGDPYKLYVTGLEEMEGLVEDLGPLVMYVDPVTYAVNVPRKAIASDAWGLHNIAYEGSGTFSTCDGIYTMSFEISVDEGSWGANGFIFTKN